jgi:acyl CoA:acetate/3-ketoacid CoA transferase alpha subunit
MQAGKFRARAVEGDWGYSSKGTEQVAVLFQLVDSGEQITWYGFMTEKTSDRTIEALISCGVQDLQTLDGLGTEDVELDLAFETYEGKERLRVKWVNRLGTGGVAMKSRMDQGQKASFAAKYQGTFLKKKQEAGVPPKTDQAPAVADTDDIPF